MKYLRITLVIVVVGAALGAYFYLHKPGSKGPAPEQPAAARFDVAAVNRVELRASPSAKPVVLARTKGQWRITSPVEGRADQGRVGALVDKIAWLETRGQVPMPKNPEEYGLGKVAGAISVASEHGKTIVLHVGKRTRDGSAVYADVEGNDRVLLLDPSFYDDLHKGITPLRDIMVIGVDPKDVYRLTITRGPERITLERSQNEWRLTQPIQARADDRGLDMVLTNAARVFAFKFVDEEPKDLSRYGLAQPRLTVDIYVKGERMPTSLYFGKALPGGHAYAKTSTDRPVFIVHKMFFDSVNRPLSDLRSKRIFAFPTEKADRISLTAGQQRLELRKEPDSGGKWVITSPVATAADWGEVDELLSYLSRLKAKSFINQPGAISAYGLNKPSEEAAVWMKGSAAPLRLSLGNRAGGTIYAVATGEPGIAQLEEYAAGRIKPDISMFREKTILRFDRNKVRSISIARAGERISLERKQGEWQLVSPVQATGDAATVDSLLFMLQNLTADTYVTDNPQGLAEYGLDKPRIEVEIAFFGKEEPMTLEVGKEAPEGRVYLMVKSRRAVYAKENWILQFVEKDVADFRRV